MRKLALRSLLVAVLAVCAATAAQAAKIEVCHLPPGNPANWHTITINDTALPAHQAHGDLVGSCLANCESLCDDGNKCTIDAVSSNTECLCQTAPRPAVSCSDGRACTVETCDPTQGCLTAPVLCQAPNPCTASVCSEPDGTCEDTPVVCPTGQTCNASTGACESTLPKCGDCLIYHDAPVCENTACEAYVCATLPQCCNIGWSADNCATFAYGCLSSGLCTQ